MDFFVYMKLPKKGITGIYKITSPSNRVYIGQARCIRNRWLSYINLTTRVNNQPKLRNSLKRHKPENHTFEIVTTCEIEDLNRLERYYQELYDCIEGGLNCVLQKADELPRVMSKESVEKQVSSRRKTALENGYYHSEETIKKIKETRKANGSYKHTEETKKKISKNQKGAKRVLVKAINIKTKEEIIDSMTNMYKRFNVSDCVIKDRIITPFRRSNIDYLNEWKFDYIDKEHKSKIKKKDSFGGLVIFLDIYTGIYFYGYKDLAFHVNKSAVWTSTFFIRNKGKLLYDRYEKLNSYDRIQNEPLSNYDR